MYRRRLLSSLALALVLPAALAGQPAPRVTRVQPSAGEVPANLLRISITFAAPVEGPVLPRIGLALDDGTQMPEPFLPQELWSPDGRILTLLFHPGRVKTGLVARETLGPILRAAEDVVLTFDKRTIKRWHVGPVDPNGPLASAWRLSPVRAASRQPLVVKLDGPIDGREEDYLAVVDVRDHLVAGHARLTQGETTWTFEPALPWRAGEYRLAVRGTLEDPAGNRLGSHFETPMGSIRRAAADAVVAFDVNGPGTGPSRQAVQ